MSGTPPCRVAWICLLIAAGASVSGTAQVNPVHFTVMGNVSVPSPGLREAVDNSIGGAGVGISTSVLVKTRRTSPSVLLPGLDFSYQTFGRDKQKPTSNSPGYKTTFNYYGIHFNTRLLPFPNTGPVTPYFDGLVGLSIFNSRTKVDKNSIQTVLLDEPPEVLNSSTDAGLGYGVGLGIFLGRPTPEDSEPDYSRFSLRVLYLWGDEARYVRRGSVVVENQVVRYEMGRTKTDMVMIQFGIYIL